MMKLTLKIIAIFMVGILMSCVPDYLHSFFGDDVCNGVRINIETGKPEYFFHYGSSHSNIVIHWGYRHYLWFFMGLSLFILQVRDIIKNDL